MKIILVFFCCCAYYLKPSVLQQQGVMGHRCDLGRDIQHCLWFVTWDIKISNNKCLRFWFIKTMTCYKYVINTVQLTHFLILYHWLSPFENLTKIEFSSDKERNSCIYINSLSLIVIILIPEASFGQLWKLANHQELRRKRSSLLLHDVEIFWQQMRAEFT